MNKINEKNMKKTTKKHEKINKMNKIHEKNMKKTMKKQ